MRKIAIGIGKVLFVLTCLSLLLSACAGQVGPPQFVLAPQNGAAMNSQTLEALPPIQRSLERFVEELKPKPPMKVTKDCNAVWDEWLALTGGTSKASLALLNQNNRRGHWLYSKLVTFCYYQGGMSGSDYTISKR